MTEGRVILEITRDETEKRTAGIKSNECKFLMPGV